MRGEMLGNWHPYDAGAQLWYGRPELYRFIVEVSIVHCQATNKKSCYACIPMRIKMTDNGHELDINRFINYFLSCIRKRRGCFICTLSSSLYRPKTAITTTIKLATLQQNGRDNVRDACNDVVLNNFKNSYIMLDST